MWWLKSLSVLSVAYSCIIPLNCVACSIVRSLASHVVRVGVDKFFSWAYHVLSLQSVVIVHNTLLICNSISCLLRFDTKKNPKCRFSFFHVDFSFHEKNDYYNATDTSVAETVFSVTLFITLHHPVQSSFTDRNLGWPKKRTPANYRQVDHYRYRTYYVMQRILNNNW